MKQKLLSWRIVGGILLSFRILLGFVIGAVLLNVRGTSEKKKVNSMRNAAYILASCLFLTAVLSYFGFWLLGLMGLTVAIILVDLTIFHR